MGTPSKGKIEDRECFRVDDTGEVRVRVAEEEELKLSRMSSEFHKPGTHNLETILGELNKESAQLLEQIRDEHTSIANLVGLIENKIRILTLVVGGQLHLDNQKPEPINLSESGIAFPHDDPLPPETLLRIQLILRPTYQDVSAYVRVMNCTPLSQVHRDSKKPHWLGCKIERILPLDQQKLSKHIFYLQTKHRKKTTQN